MSKVRFYKPFFAPRPLLTALAGLAVALPAGASAQISANELPIEQEEMDELILAPSLPQSIAPSDELFGEEPLAEAELAQATGLQDNGAMLALSRNHAVVSDNEVGDNSTTGSVSVSDSAFGNVSGFSMVNMNTGNNSAINAAMNINLQINYAAPGL